MRILASILLMLMLLPGYSGTARLSLWPAEFDLEAERVALDWRDPRRKLLGELTYLGGVRLKSRIDGFGGFSALNVADDRFTLLGDGGNFMRFTMDRDWRVSRVVSGALPDGPGRGWRKLDRDSESMTVDPASGSVWVGFEQAQQIWRFDRDLRRAEARTAPRAMADWPRNGGPEAMARLRDGSFVVLAEIGRGKADAPRPGLWFAGDPTRAPDRGFAFRYRSPPGYRPTDLAELPDGRLIVIHRRASVAEGFTAAVSIVDRFALRPGRVVQGRVIARFAAPVVHDNFEAVAAVREGNDTIIWIASDDNQLFLQRSLLLKFRLEEDPGRRQPVKRRTARNP